MYFSKLQIKEGLLFDFLNNLESLNQLEGGEDGRFGPDSVNIN